MEDHIYHATVLNLHQPPGNMEHLLEHQPWEAKEILWALDRIPRSVWGNEDIARFTLSLSGTLLEVLSNPEFQSRVYGVVDCGSLLWYFQNQRAFEIVGTGYYHPVLPLIPKADREEHLKRWQDIAGHVFWRKDYQGLWPPEMSFSMELIPLAKRMGYRWVLVDVENLEPVDEMSWGELRYRPHFARYGGEEIIVVARDRSLSDAQEGGMEFGWFEHEAHERTKHCDFTPLITTCSDGENGGWFRNVNAKGNFWGVYFDEMVNKIRNNWTKIRPSFINDYIDRFGAYGEVKIIEGAWNTGWHDGKGFVQWTGSQAQKDAFNRTQAVSDSLHEARAKMQRENLQNPELEHQIGEAFWRLMRAETSCNFYWGEAWVHKCHQDLDAASQHLDRIYEILG